MELLPEPEAVGLRALMLLQESQRAARSSSAGELILLNEQNRSLWNRDQIAEGSALVERALSSRRFGPYTLQAAIAAVHANAPAAAATDWSQIVGLYDVLLRADPSPVVDGINPLPAQLRTCFYPAQSGRPLRTVQDPKLWPSS